MIRGARGLVGACLVSVAAVTAGVAAIGSAALAEDAPDIVVEAPVADPDADVAAELWIDPTLPELLLGRPLPEGPGSARPAPSPQKGGSQPSRDPEEVRRSQADAAPALRPGFVDDYTRLWRDIEAGAARVENLKGTLATARVASEYASSDMALAVRVRHHVEYEHRVAADQLDTAAKDLYIAGSSDVDLIIGVIGSEPDDLLSTLDSLVYMRSASGDEDRTYRSTRSAVVRAQSAAASTRIAADDARELVAEVEDDLSTAQARLAADREAFDRLVAAAAPQTVVGPSGCPKAVLDGTVPEGIDIRMLCRQAVKGAATPQAAFAIKWALVRLGAPYACDGVGRLAPWRYDCSSYVSRAFAEGAGLQTAEASWAPSTRTMLPWDGAELDPHYAPVGPNRLKPGDLVLYDTCPDGEACPYRHVVLYLGPLEPGGIPYMAHTNECGSVAHVAPFWGTDAANFLGVRRVLPAAGERVKAPEGALTSPARASSG